MSPLDLVVQACLSVGKRLWDLTLKHCFDEQTDSLTNLFTKGSVQCSVLVDVKCLLVPELFNIDRFSWIEAKPLSELLHFIIE